MITVLDYQLTETELNLKIQKILLSLMTIADNSAEPLPKALAYILLGQFKSSINLFTENGLSVGVILASRKLKKAADLYLQYDGQIIQLALGAAYGKQKNYANAILTRLHNDRTTMDYMAAWAARGKNDEYADELISRIGGDTHANLNLISACATAGCNYKYAAQLHHRIAAVIPITSSSVAVIPITSSSVAVQTDNAVTQYTSVAASASDAAVPQKASAASAGDFVLSAESSSRAGGVATQPPLKRSRVFKHT